MMNQTSHIHEDYQGKVERCSIPNGKSVFSRALLCLQARQLSKFSKWNNLDIFCEAVVFRLRRDHLFSCGIDVGASWKRPSFELWYRVALDCDSQELAVRTWEQQINLNTAACSIKIALCFIRGSHQKIFKNKAFLVLPNYLVKEGFSISAR